jgi:hypothetical protein
MSETTEIQNAEVVEDHHLMLVHKAEIDIQISTAKAFPRSLDQFIKDSKSMVSVSPEIAEKCVYRLKRGGNTIEGPSVRLAEIILACYGNITAGARIVANDGKAITAEGVCIDAQRNVRITKEVKVRITDKNGKQYNDDMQIVAGNAACSKAMRNAIFTVVPTVFVNAVMETAKSVARGDEKTLPERRKAAVDWYKRNGATEALLCAALDIKHVNDIMLDHMELLNGWKVAATEGEGGTLKDRLLQILKDAASDAEESELDPKALLAELETVAQEMAPSEYERLKGILEEGREHGYQAVADAITKAKAQ